ncbi:hypothetical protein BGZ83_008704 [Gryganskiella cystojenkinii]|nr:hypothetical protein BGZ83_008704 [Gryganskiella cystojenkinii]
MANVVRPNRPVASFQPRGGSRAGAPFSPGAKARSPPQQSSPSSPSSSRSQWDQNVSKISKAILNRNESDPVRLRIRQLDDKTTVQDLRSVLLNFGDLVDLAIDKDENDGSRSVHVKFASRPKHVLELLQAKVNGRVIDWILLPFQEQHDTKLIGVQGTSLELGVKLEPSVYCPWFRALSDVRIRIREQNRALKLEFSRQFQRGKVEYEIESRFETMEPGCIQVERFGNKAAVTIHLRYPPHVARFDPELPTIDGAKWSRGQSLRRILDIPVEGADSPNASKASDPGSNPRSKDQRPALPTLPTHPDPPSLWTKLAKWLVIRVQTGPTQSNNLEKFISQCKAYNLFAPTTIPLTLQDRFDLLPPRVDLLKDLPFEVRYLLESALSFNYLLEYDLTETFCETLMRLEPTKASYILEQIIDNRKRLWNPEDFVTTEAKKLEKTTIRPRIVPPQWVLLRKITITPTTIYLLPPSVETSNRIIRNFSSLSDYFLRVEFSDEGNLRLWSKDTGSHTHNAIYNRIFDTLQNGVLIGNRKYEFLAFSSSQLRDNAAWFFCSEKGEHDPDSIRKWMGDFSHIKSIAKYGARMGQCFSSTTAIATLDASQVKMIDDIERNGHNFSDGCGKLSFSLARDIGIELEKETTPSAFQIRLGGSKGVLAVSNYLSGRQVEIRPSMKKFDVAHYVLEVIKTSGIISSYLNRQIIILLSALGVPDNVFLDLRDKMIRDLEKIETDDQVATQMLLQNWDEQGTSKMMVSMIRAGFLQRQDPMIKNLLTLFKLQMLELLRRKARIFVPKGAYLLGICDETGTLNEGEIFVQLSSVENITRRSVIQGPCVVVRSPCFHPGDIRVVQAVKRPELMHLHDVVVFNTKGTRGIPSMCSGGDLDGDDFTVIWDPEIVDRVRVRPPMDYTGRETTAAKDVTISDIQRFFVQYAVANNLGVIANAHLALSDRLEEGPIHGKCILLAQLHSDAVDFPKSGKPAVITPDLRPKKYPDFMEKRPDQSYRSNRILGRVYRDCGKPKAFTPKDYSMSFNKALLVDGYQRYMGDALRCKNEYDNEVLSLMNQYGVKSDFEVVSGFIMDVDVTTNRRENEIRKSIVGAFKRIRQRFRLELEQEFFGPESKAVMRGKEDEVRKKAAAWYAVCYKDLHENEHGQSYTFAWVAWDHLCELASRIRISPKLENRPTPAVAHPALSPALSKSEQLSDLLTGHGSGTESASSSSSSSSSSLPSTSAPISSPGENAKAEGGGGSGSDSPTVVGVAAAAVAAASPAQVVGVESSAFGSGASGSRRGSVDIEVLVQDHIGLQGEDSIGISSRGSSMTQTHAEVMRLAMEQERARVSKLKTTSTMTVPLQQLGLGHRSSYYRTELANNNGESITASTSTWEPLVYLPSVPEPIHREKRATVSQEGAYLTVGPDVDDDTLLKALMFG